MLSYRAPASVDGRFSRSNMGDVERPAEEPELGVRAHEKKTNLPYFAVESYLQYQGKKFIRRFDANCYIQLTYSLIHTTYLEEEGVFRRSSEHQAAHSGGGHSERRALPVCLATRARRRASER